MSRLIALHRNFEKGEAAKGAPVFTVAEKGKVKKLTGLPLIAFIKKLKTGDIIRVTSTAYFLEVLADIGQQGVAIETCHWHATGIDKGLKPEGIVKAFLDLPASIFRKMTFRSDLNAIRNLISARNAIMKYRKSAYLQLNSVMMGNGWKAEKKPTKKNPEGVTGTAPTWMEESLAYIRDIERDTEQPVDKQIAMVASGIPECITLNEILGVKGSWMTSASLFGYLGDIKRFPSVSALWHYAGQHVVNGKAPKRAKGQTMTWNPSLRTALWVWVDSMLKTKNDIWRKEYEKFLKLEMSKNKKRPKDERISDVHAGRRARRLVTKEVLKTIWITLNALGSGKVVAVDKIKPSRFVKPVAKVKKVQSVRKKVVKPVRKVIAKRKLTIAA